MESNEETELAICCSGGGIRSASYCLGALQSLQAGGLLGRAGLISSVSGGSYITASRALVAHGLSRSGPEGVPAYAPGSPEEQNLRDNTHYLAPNASTVLVGVLSLLVGVAVTFVLALAPLYAAAHAWGWLLRWRGVLCPGSAPDCGPPGAWTAHVSSPGWWLWPIAAGVVTLVLFWWWWSQVAGSAKHRDPAQALARATGWAALVAALLAVAMLVVPLLLAWLTQPHSGVLGTLLSDLGFTSGGRWRPAALLGVYGAVLAIAQQARSRLAAWRAPGAQAPGQGGGIFAQIGGWLRSHLLAWLAAIVIVLVAVVLGLRWVRDGAAAGYSLAQLWPVLIALGIMLATRMFADINRISMHDFYRWRLASAYAVTRKPEGPQDPAHPRRGRRGAGESAGVTAEPGALLSELAGQVPAPVLCATANINAVREVPVGRGGLSMTFDPKHVILRGENPGEHVTARTLDYEHLVGGRRLTLFDISAISGAAVSPLMGAATRSAYRLLLTLTNVRLGVWLPHPAVVAAARRQLDEQNAGQRARDRWWHALRLLVWYAWAVHPGWGAQTEGLGGREARLWAYVLRLREKRKRLGRVFYHALQPTLGMLWAEAAGRTSYRSTWVCVTDGGHYDNLGLVEALQRGARNIVVLDASGDKADTWSTLGSAIALARVDAGVDIELNPTVMCPSSPQHPGEVVRPWACGTFAPVPGWRAGPAGTIWVCKLGWWTGAPWDVQAYAASHREFPGDPTLHQLYDAAEFDAYRELGHSSMNDALGNGLGLGKPCPAPRQVPPASETGQSA